MQIALGSQALIKILFVYYYNNLFVKLSVYNYNLTQYIDKNLFVPNTIKF